MQNQAFAEFFTYLEIMWSNFHTHSSFCDGKGDLSEFCLEAKKLPLLSLGFSSHAPLPFPSKWCMKPETLATYLETIDGLRSSGLNFPIYKGLEVDFIPGVISPADFISKLDYTIGSVHFVDSFPDGRRWEIDGLNSFFLEGLKTIFDNDVRAAVTRYFELTRQMIATSPPTLVGHLDKIKIQNIDNSLFNENDSWYRHEVLKTLDLILETDSIVEVNTRGLYQKKSLTTYPSPWILEYIIQKKIPITISSDAHHPKDLINQFPETAGMLRTLGARKISILLEGKWQELEFNEKGITLEHSGI